MLARIVNRLTICFNNLAKLGKAKGVFWVSVYHYIPPPQPDSLTPEQKREAAALLRQGWSLRQVASHYGVSRGSIHRLAKKEGIELQPTLPKLIGEKQQEALALLKQGVSLRQVAKRLGVNHETVRGLVKRIEEEQE